MEQKNLKWWVLLTVIVGTFLGRLDQTIVNLALPKIINDFGITVSAAGWIATAYILANAIFVPVWGKLGDTIGRKKVYIFGFSIFIFGSVLAGLAWNLTSMIIFRVIQAIASSADYPTAMAILTVTFPAGKDRARALGIWSVSFAAATVFGPLLGGPLIDTFGWRSVFLVNLPIGLIGIFMAVKFVHESVSERETIDFDWIGAIYLGISLASLVLVLDKGMDWGWLSANSIIAYLISIIFGIIFYKNEMKHSEPIVDFKFFKNGIFVGTLLNNFIVFMGLMGSVFLIPIFTQTFMGLTATQSGYVFIPLALFMVIGVPIGTRFVGKVRANIIIAISTFIAAIGIFLLSHIDARSTIFDLIYPMAIMAFGMGLGMSQRTSLIASAVPESEIGIASSVLALVRNISGAFGIAIFATILNNSIESHVLSIAKYSSVHIPSPAVYQQAAGLIILKAQIAGYSTVFLIASIVVFIGGIAALFMKVSKSDELRASNKEIHVE